MTLHQPPVTCPTCAGHLHISELSCESCGTRVSGAFATCEFCTLNAEHRDLLRVFLSSRGNMKELERHLGVSYPTARARLTELLVALGLDTAAPEPKLGVLEALARGEIDVDQALNELGD